MTLCVYAITGPGRLQTRAHGHQGEPLRLVTAGPVAAIVGDLARAPRGGVAELRRYDAALRRIAARRAAILPARFGTCFASEDELLEVLRSRRASLRAALILVRRRVQMTIRIVLPGRAPNARVRTVSGRQRPIAPAHAGTAYLRRRAADLERQQEIPGFEDVRRAVRRWVRAERVDTRAGVASVYHLVPRASAAAYRAAFDRARAESGLRMVVSGPWPAYAFATL